MLENDEMVDSLGYQGCFTYSVENSPANYTEVCIAGIF